MTKVREARILITGASRGIGEAVAEELARRGARLALAARSESALQKVAGRLSANGAETHVIPADVSKEADVKAMVAMAEEVLGGLDVLINNAGLGLSGPVKDIKPEDFRYVLEVNVVAALVASQAALPAMLRRKAGHIVNVGSVASHVATPKLGGYSATKFALKALSDAMRMELRDRGIRVTLICPGLIKTEFVANVKGQVRGHLPKQPVGAPASEVGKATANAIARNQAEVFVPRYYQAMVGANSVAPQFWRQFGARGIKVGTRLIERFG
jgi:short-subunit dehydrogenase